MLGLAMRPALSSHGPWRIPWQMLSGIALIALILLSACDAMLEKMAPEELAFTRHCFDLLRSHDYAALETLATPALRTGLSERLDDMAALIPNQAPIASRAGNFNISTNNGYTMATIAMAYQFPGGWLELDVSFEGTSGALALTAINLRPTEPPADVGWLPLLGAVPLVVFVAVMIGRLVYRRRATARGALHATPQELAHVQGWRAALEEAGSRTPWFWRLQGMYSVELSAALTPEQCKERLRPLVAAEWKLRFKESERPEFEGHVGRSAFRLTRRHSVLLTNRYQTVLYGRFLPSGTGTRMLCRLGPQHLARAMAGLFMLFAWAAVPMLIFNSQGFHGLSLLVGILPPLAVTGFMAVAVAVNRKQALKDGPDLLDFLGQTLGATEATEARPSAIERTTPR